MTKRAGARSEGKNEPSRKQGKPEGQGRKAKKISKKKNKRRLLLAKVGSKPGTIRKEGSISLVSKEGTLLRNRKQKERRTTISVKRRRDTDGPTF